MSAHNLERPRVLHVPPGDGDTFSVYGDLDTIKVNNEESHGAMSLVETVVPPRNGPPPHIHHKEHESIYVLDGEVDILDGDRWFRVATRGYVFMPMETLHAFRNPHDEPGKILLLFTPAGFEDYLKKIGEMVAAGDLTGEHDIESVIPIAASYGMELLPDYPVPPPPA